MCQKLKTIVLVYFPFFLVLLIYSNFLTKIVFLSCCLCFDGLGLLVGIQHISA